MKKKYEIAEIVHSGRKGIRNTPVDDWKYDGLIGSEIWWDLDDVKQFRCTRWDFKHHPKYDWWDTSEVLALGRNKETKMIELETANTIYKLKEVEAADGSSEWSRTPGRERLGDDDNQQGNA